jgi:hypothetical protein
MQRARRAKEGDDDFRGDELRMLEGIYEQLRDASGAVPFAAVERFFDSHELFYYCYNVFPHRLLSLLREEARRFSDRLTRREFFAFFLSDRATVAEFKAATKKHVANVCVLP